MPFAPVPFADVFSAEFPEHSWLPLLPFPSVHGERIGRGGRHEAFVASGLIKRRVELAGDIEKANEALRCMVQDLENLDATILQFEHDFRVEAIKPKASGRRRIRRTEAR